MRPANKHILDLQPPRRPRGEVLYHQVPGRANHDEAEEPVEDVEAETSKRNPGEQEPVAVRAPARLEDGDAQEPEPQHE